MAWEWFCIVKLQYQCSETWFCFSKIMAWTFPEYLLHSHVHGGGSYFSFRFHWKISFSLKPMLSILTKIPGPTQNFSSPNFWWLFTLYLWKRCSIQNTCAKVLDRNRRSTRYSEGKEFSRRTICKGLGRVKDTGNSLHGIQNEQWWETQYYIWEWSSQGGQTLERLACSLALKAKKS